MPINSGLQIVQAGIFISVILTCILKDKDILHTHFTEHHPYPGRYGTFIRIQDDRSLILSYKSKRFSFSSIRFRIQFQSFNL